MPDGAPFTMVIRTNSRILAATPKCSNIDEKYFEKLVKGPFAFDNVEYELQISGTVATDQRVMTFIDHLWGFEVTGGADQNEPLTVLEVNGFVPVSCHDKLGRLFLYARLCFFSSLAISLAIVCACILCVHSISFAYHIHCISSYPSH